MKSRTGAGAGALLGDAASIAGLALIAAIIGWGLNGLRREPLPLRYASPRELIATAANPAREIGLEAFQALAAGSQGLVLDARPGVFYGEGHVPGALNLARDSFEADFARLRPVLEKNRGLPVAIYCSGADCEDSDVVAAGLGKLGYRDLLIFREGWEQWTAAGLPEQKGK